MDPSWHCLGGSKLALFGWVQVGIVLLLKFCWRRIGLCLFGSLKGEAVGVTYTPPKNSLSADVGKGVWAC